MLKTGHESGASKGLARGAWVSIWGASLSFLIAAGVGLMVDSVTLLLEAAASLTILISALLMRFSAQKIHSPPDDAFHYGYHKYETFTSVIERVLIIASCVMSIKFAVQDMIHAEEIESYALPAVAMFFSGLLSLGVMLYLKHLSGRVRSQMIEASALHWLSDALLSFGVSAGFVAGLWIHHAGYSRIAPYVDPVMALVLAGCLLMTPFRGLMGELSELLDAAPSPEVRDKVRGVVDGYKARVAGVHRLRTRKAGQKIFTEVCFLVREDLTAGHAEALAQAFERDLDAHFPGCDVIVHFKPHR